MDEILYEDIIGDYFLLDYSPSHSEMVIRRISKTNQNDIFNIDLFFKAVKNINITPKLTGIKIYKSVRTADSPLMTSHLDRKSIYKIVDGQGNVGYIDASVFVVFHNKLDILTTSLGEFTWSKENKEMFSVVIN
jgi:hypothetical protein